MHHTESAVDGLLRPVDDHAEGNHVVDLIERDSVALHLGVDGRQLFQAACDLRVKGDLRELCGEDADHLLDIALASCRSSSSAAAGLSERKARSSSSCFIQWMPSRCASGA